MTFEARSLDDIAFSESPALGDDELNALFEQSWPAHSRTNYQPVLARSLVYIAARQGEQLVGFVNVATDGGIHAFLLDTTVLPEFRDRGIGSELIRRAIAAAEERRIEWVHVDFDETHDILYRRAGFRPTLAGLVKLAPTAAAHVEIAQPSIAPAPVSAASPFQKLRATGLLIQCFIGAVLVMALAGVVLGVKDPSPADSGMFALFYLGAGIVMLLRAHRAGLDADKLFGPLPTPDTLRLTLIAIPLGMLAIAGFWILFLPLSFIAPDFVRTWAIDNSNRMPVHNIATWAGQFCVAVIIAPVVEEVLFRGMLMQRWALKWGTAPAVILSSALFALGHVELLGHFVFGVAMCALYIRTKSLWVPIAAHSLNNFVASMFGLVGVISPQKQGSDMSLMMLRSQWWVGLVLLGLALLLLEAYRRRFWAGVDLKALLAGPVPYS